MDEKQFEIMIGKLDKIILILQHQVFGNPVLEDERRDPRDDNLKTMLRD